MNSFLRKILWLCLPVMAIFAAYIYFLMDGNADSFYLRFTTPKYSSLIIGSSRGAQGIKPSVFNGSGLTFEKPVYNFCFALGASSYSQTYAEAIRKKLLPNSLNGLFIIEVNPVTLSVKPHDDTEKKSFLNLHSVSSNPNFEYVLKFFDGPYYKILAGKFGKSFMTLNPDGWLQINAPVDAQSVENRKKQRLPEYKSMFQTMSWSDYRFQSLRQIIAFLRPRGTVVLVRVPSSREMRDMEFAFMPGFDARMESLAGEFDILYINMIDDFDLYKTTDGNHLQNESAEMVSKEILKRISADSRPGRKRKELLG